MEHRYSPRFVGDMKVLIYKSDLPVAIGWLRNISRHGLFIVSDYDNMPIHQLLEIEFLGDSRSGTGRNGNGRSDDSHNGDSHRRCRATVVHKTRRGFGLAVDEQCARSCALAAEIVGRYRQHSAASPTRFAEAQADPALYL